MRIEQVFFKLCGEQKIYRKEKKKQKKKRIFVFPPLMRISENGNAHENVMGNGHDMKVDTLIL